MSDGVEIYVRNSSERTLLTFHIPDDHRAEFFARLAKGGPIELELPTNLEFSVLNEWITDVDQRNRLKDSETYIHCRVPISAMVVH